MADQRSTKASNRPPVRLNQSIAAQPRRGTLPEVKVPHPFQGFINFVREQGVVGLGVGFVIGASANTLIKSIVDNILNPLIGLATGGIDLSQKTVCLQSTDGACINVLKYGHVVSDLITFVAILAVVYVVVKRLKLDRLDKKTEKK